MKLAAIDIGTNSMRLLICDYINGQIINRKKFVTLIRESKGSSYGNQEKLQDLLIRLGLQDRSYSNGKDRLYERISVDINYDAVFKIINKERKHTMNYLSVTAAVNMEDTKCF